MRLIWLGLAVLVIVMAIGGSLKMDNPMTRLGLYCVAAAGGLWLLAILIA